jgi:hypothetical protein
VLQERQEAAAAVRNRGGVAGCTCNERAAAATVVRMKARLEPGDPWYDQASFCCGGRRRDRRLEDRRFSTRRRQLTPKLAYEARLRRLLQYFIITTNIAETLADNTAEQKKTWGHVQCVILRGAISTPNRVLYFFGDACVSDLEEHIKLEAGTGNDWYALCGGRLLGRGDR